MTKKEPKEKRVGDVIDAAVAEFAEKGFDRTSMDAIARRAGLTKGGLYHHFASKDEILLAANERFMAPLHKMMVKAETVASPVAGLKGFLGAYFDYWLANPKYLVFISITLTKALQEPAWWPVMTAYSDEMTAFYARLLARAVALGEIASGDIEAQATTLLGAADGLAAYVCMDANLTPTIAAARLCRALCAPPVTTKEGA